MTGWPKFITKLLSFKNQIFPRLLSLLWIALTVPFIFGCQLADNRIAGKINPSQTPPGFSPVPAVQSIADQIFYRGDAVNLTPTVLGEVHSYALTPDNLPTGLSFDTRTGVISGTPTAATTALTYSLEAMGPGGFASTPFALEVGYRLVVDSTGDTLPNANDVALGDEACLDADNQCSLRAALQEAVALSPYTVEVSVPANTYTLTSSIQLNSISNKIFVRGVNSSSTVIDGANSTKLFYLSAVNTNAQVSYFDMAFKNGNGLGNGGAFYLSDGSYEFTRCLFESNLVTSGRGGAIWADPTNPVVITTEQSQFISNSASSISNSNGGAIHVGRDDHVLTVIDSYFSGNTVGEFWAGGSIGGYDQPGSEIHIEGSTFIDNGKIGGGGIALLGYCTKDLTKNCSIKNSTFVASAQDNHLVLLSYVAPFGSPQNTWRLENNTFLSSGTLSMLYSEGAAKIDLLANVFHNPLSSNACETTVGLTSLGYNIDHANTCGLNHSTDLASTDPLLDPAGLVDNGGYTPTVLLQFGSPAKDIIPSDQCGTLTDQRGLPRPIGSGCDAGAVEMQQ
ncbi:MAG: putative Ig domain-containing protein [Pseudobdellovibrionaceae bacterium]|nr:putative Ig domain-containing protein [Bdellovibrionales bacterium]USN48335.1 MAG: putative Ig domain-containing protein [Pseudobdellovibrionaceae bacterium]